MARKRSARVCESATGTSGDLTLTGAFDTTYVTFASRCATSDTFKYALQTGTGQWERGIGTYSAANTLTRTTVQENSSGTTSPLTLSGTITVWIDAANVDDEVAAAATTGQVLFNNAGALAGASGATWDDTAHALTIQSAVAAASADGFVLQTSAVATVGAQKWSPRLRFKGSGWKTGGTAGPVSVEFVNELIPVQGSTFPLGKLSWSYRVPGLSSGALTEFMYVDLANSARLYNRAGFSTDSSNSGAFTFVVGATTMMTLNDSLTLANGSAVRWGATVTAADVALFRSNGGGLSLTNGGDPNSDTFTVNDFYDIGLRNLNVYGAITYSNNNGVAAGTNAQGQGLIGSSIAYIGLNTSSPGGVTLPTPVAGRTYTVINNTANTANVYPASGCTIDTRAVDTAIPLPPGGTMTFTARTALEWQSSGYPGWRKGAGGSVTQATSKTTGVTLNTPTGRITMAATAVTGGTNASFVLTNNCIEAGDVLVVNHVSGGVLGVYSVGASCGAGQATITIRSLAASGSLSDAVVLQYALIKGAIS